MASKHVGRNGWRALYHRPDRKTGLTDGETTVWADRSGRDELVISAYYPDSRTKTEIWLDSSGAIMRYERLENVNMSEQVFGPRAV